MAAGEGNKIIGGSCYGRINGPRSQPTKHVTFTRDSHVHCPSFMLHFLAGLGLPPDEDTGLAQNTLNNFWPKLEVGASDNDEYITIYFIK